MKIYKETLHKLCKSKKTDMSKLSRELGYNRNYLAMPFSKKPDASHDYPFAVASGIMAILGCTEEELTAVPKTATATATISVNTAPTQIVHGVDPELIKEGFRMIHSDLQELIRLWKPTTETIKIGGEHSK